MPVIFHIVPVGGWPPDTREYRGESLDIQGFIHCSTAGQLIPVANRFFRERDDLVVIVIDEGKVRSPVIYENLEGGTEAFPHIYGPLQTGAVIDCFALPPKADGTFTAPAELSRY